jgi:DNA-binding NtrC family response regulator
VKRTSGAPICVGIFWKETGKRPETHWKTAAAPGWHVKAHALTFGGDPTAPSFLMCTKKIPHIKQDIQVHFKFNAPEPAELGFVLCGRISGYAGTPDAGGFLIRMSENKIFLKENFQTIDIGACPELSKPSWHTFDLEKCGSLIIVSIDNKEVFKSYEASSLLAREQGYIGFLAYRKVGIKELVVNTRPSTVNPEWVRPNLFDIHFKESPEKIYQMQITKRHYGPGILNGVLFLNITDLREKERALAYSEKEREILSRENINLRSHFQADKTLVEGGTPEIKKVYAVVREVAPTQSSVLVKGETGTGKELLAHRIHALSLRSKGPFIKVDCAALPENLLESELFGHEKGAFTSALERRIGRFELAHQGTIFLDEIGNISPSIQAKLLRVLQDKCFERLGGTETIHSDFRLICATNEDLEKLVEKDRFRKDLYFRINVVQLNIPCLKARAGDIPDLSLRFIEEAALTAKKPIKSISADALALLKSYHWPGNIRELKNAIEKAFILSTGHTLDKDDFEFLSIQRAPFRPADKRADMPVVTHQRIHMGLKRHKGNVNRTAEDLGIKSSQLYYFIKKFNIQPKAYRPIKKQQSIYEEMIIDLLEQKGPLPVHHIHAALNISFIMLKRAIKSLLETGFIRAKGAGLSATYELSKSKA